jgi:hypothetical protein
MAINQCSAIIEYIREHGSITQHEADGIGITRLPSRIFDLKKLGFTINYEWVTVPTRYGNGKTRVKRYMLEEVNG